LQGADGNVLGIHDFLCLPEWTGVEVQEEPHLDVSSKIIAKAEASQKRMASTSSATSSHVAKRTRSALAQSSSSTTHPSLVVGDDDDESDDDDDDACVEISLVTPLRSAAVIPSLGNEVGSSVAPTTKDSRGKGVMVDDDAAPSASASRSRPSSGPSPLFRDVSSDAINTDFFPFSAGPYYATYHVDGVTQNCWKASLSKLEWDLLPITTNNLRIVLSGVKPLSGWLPVSESATRSLTPSWLFKTWQLRNHPSVFFGMTNGREMTPPPGFSTPPQIPNITTSERPPVTTTVFAATTPENTPFAYHASTSTNPNLTISPAIVEANYEILESTLRE
ncbi:hypothetical protein Tco_1099967, partial [Tanacetum coccineum]